MDVRELLEKVREDPKRIDELLKSLKDRRINGVLRKELLDLANRLKDRDTEAYNKIMEVLRTLVKAEEIEAYMEENIEEYET